MSGDITPYTNLITSEHAAKPNFLAVMAALLQPVADQIQVAAELPTLFDLDTAVGQQLDYVGQWIGLSRYLQTPLTGVYFSWGVTGLGWGEGSWQGQFDSGTQLSTLPDDAYRTLLRAKVAANHWDGTVPSAELIWNQLFASENFTISIKDNGNMTMNLFLVGSAPPDAVTQALFQGGYLDLKPVGVQIVSRVVSIVVPIVTGSLSVAGSSPIVGSGIKTAVGAAVLTGASPIIVSGITTLRTPTVGASALAGVVPVLSRGTVISPIARSLSASGATPILL